MPTLESLWNSTPFWGILGLIGGIIVTSVFFFMGKKRKILEYEIISTPLITKNVANISGLKVTLNGTPVKTLTSTTIHFFNMGSEKIEPTDFAPLEPLGISISGNVLHFQLRASTGRHNNHNMNLRIEPTDEQTLNIAFDFFRPKRTFSLTVLHEGRLSVLGELKEGKVRPYRNRLPFSPLFFSLALILSVTATFVASTSDKAPLTLSLFLIFAFILLFIINRISSFISGDSSLASELRRLANPYEDNQDEFDDY